MRNFLVGLVLAGAIASAGCSGSDSMTGPTLPPLGGQLVGTWFYTGPGFFSSITITSDTGYFGTFGGTVRATARDCGAGVPCQLTGTSFDGVQRGANASISFSFLQAPIGATVTGTLYADGTFRGLLVTRDNAHGIGPDSVTFTR